MNTLIAKTVEHGVLKNRTPCIGAWRGLCGQWIISSEQITDERYEELIMNLTSLLEVDEQVCWFQQDGAMALTANSFVERVPSWKHYFPKHASPSIYGRRIFMSWDF
jgi:hypothetical protein